MTSSTVHLGQSPCALSLAFGEPSGASRPSTCSFGNGCAGTAVGPEPTHASKENNQSTPAYIPPGRKAGWEGAAFDHELVKQRKQASADVSLARPSSTGTIPRADESRINAEPAVLDADGALGCEVTGSVGDRQSAPCASSSSAAPLAAGIDGGVPVYSPSTGSPSRSTGGDGVPRPIGISHASSNDVRVSAEVSAQRGVPGGGLMVQGVTAGAGDVEVKKRQERTVVVVSV